MKLAFILYKYFPFGGLQRDFLRIAKVCQQSGHEITVYTMSWEGERPNGFEIHTHRPFSFTAQTRNNRFQSWIESQLSEKPADVVVGFNKMPGLDVYYAADTCFEHKATTLRKSWYKYSSRYRHFSANERAVFGAESNTVSLLISANEKAIFQKHYGTPDHRLHLLPPGISRDRQRPENADAIHAEFRKEFGITDDEHLVLMVGSGFKTKGVDRSLLAIKGLPEDLRNNTRLFIIGQDDPRRFKAQAKTLGISNQVTFFQGRDDIPRFLVGADLLIHPAYNENTGTVLLEALVAGLPVLCTDICGYAHYITDADAGDVAPSPFSQNDLNSRLVAMLSSDQKQDWQQNALSFAQTADIYSLPERAAEIIESTGNTLKNREPH
ncbi:glycosyltransferase family 4 protein [Parendozoicomonas sp. Alg238-R29]|uniref:glycosyltransferase family 4 protein n=1 Tax=Parendozoicomonas sp. Alg238-R29 TaxID=2993446 RepID=UPI00248DADF1|nr:glycosyltransferase family 4 protein [Parendozoicomonas sp. Alg238-R29]